MKVSLLGFRGISLKGDSWDVLESVVPSVTETEGNWASRVSDPSGFCTILRNL